MLRISKKLDYALIVLVHLAGIRKDALMSARDIADAYGLPLPITAGILKTLAKKDIVRSIRGVRGGYSLNVDSSTFTLNRIVEAIEGPLALADCLKKAEGPEDKECCYLERCPVRRPVRKLHETLQDVLGSVTLWELAEWRDDEQPAKSAIAAVGIAPCAEGDVTGSPYRETPAVP